VFCAPAPAGAARSDDYIACAIHLLRGLYPGLHGEYPRGVHVEIEDDQDLFNRRLDYPDIVYPAEIHLYAAGHAEPWDPQYSLHPEPVLSAHIQFLGEGKGLRLLWVQGPFVRGRVDKLTKEVDEHVNWRDARVVEALKAAGAKFGPDDKAAFARAMPWKALEQSVGRLEIASAEFDVRLHLEEGQQPKANLTWRVVAKAYSPDGRYETDCIMLFEPFEGALMSYDISSLPRPIQ
jgi:hypothetical protein